MENIFTYENGFNAGYLLQTEMPAFMEVITASVEPFHDYVSGLQDGANEFLMELEQSRLDALNRENDRNKSEGREQ